MNAMNEQKKNFKLNEEAKHKINDEYVNSFSRRIAGLSAGAGKRAWSVWQTG